MHSLLMYSPGQLATVTYETYDGYGQLSDGYSAPIITKILFPNLSLASGFPTPMTNIDTGIFQFKFTLPTGTTAIGNYVIVIKYIDHSGNTKNDVVEVQVNVPFANFTVSPG